MDGFKPVQTIDIGDGRCTVHIGLLALVVDGALAKVAQAALGAAPRSAVERVRRARLDAGYGEPICDRVRATRRRSSTTAGGAATSLHFDHRRNMSTMLPETAASDASHPLPTRSTPWLPRRVLVTRSAMGWEHGRSIAERAAALGVEVRELPTDRLALDLPADERRAYAEAKQTLAIVVAPPSKRRLQPIAPSADWRVDLAEGCPAHCSYCYLAGSLKGPPITRVYANLPEILAQLPDHLGKGTVTSRKASRAGEGTTFEASCYTDPLALDFLTGSLSTLIAYFGAWDAPVQLRFTSKFDAVEPLLRLVHRGRTRMRASINPARFARFEGGTSSVAARLAALAQMGEAGYPIGLTIAPIIAAEGWEEAYAELIDAAAQALSRIPSPDLTIELITHRYTPGSREVLVRWYPASKLEMGTERRTEKRNKFGAVKQVYDAATMRTLRTFFTAEIARALPSARILYWT